MTVVFILYKLLIDILVNNTFLPVFIFNKYKQKKKVYYKQKPSHIKVCFSNVKVLR